MGSKAKTPKAPDYTAIAQQQQANDLKNWDMGLTASRADQSNPFGRQDWNKDATTGEWSMTQSLAPEYEATRQQQAANQGQMAGMLGETMGGYDNSQVDLGGAPAMPTVGGYNQQAMDTIRALQQPGLERSRASKEAQLAAMGMGTGSGQAWNAEQQNIGDRESRADMQAILGGIDQGNKQFGQGMDLHNTGVNDILKQKSANIGQMQGMYALAPQVTMPQFQNTNVAGPGKSADLMGAANAQYSANMGAANAKNAASSNMTNGLLGLAGTIGGSFIGAPWLGAALTTANSAAN